MGVLIQGGFRHWTAQVEVGPQGTMTTLTVACSLQGECSAALTGSAELIHSLEIRLHPTAQAEGNLGQLSLRSAPRLLSADVYAPDLWKEAMVRHRSGGVLSGSWVMDVDAPSPRVAEVMGRGTPQVDRIAPAPEQGHGHEVWPIISVRLDFSALL